MVRSIEHGISRRPTAETPQSHRTGKTTRIIHGHHRPRNETETTTTNSGAGCRRTRRSSNPLATPPGRPPVLTGTAIPILAHYGRGVPFSGLPNKHQGEPTLRLHEQDFRKPVKRPVLDSQAHRTGLRPLRFRSMAFAAMHAVVSATAVRFKPPGSFQWTMHGGGQPQGHHHQPERARPPSHGPQLEPPSLLGKPTDPLEPSRPRSRGWPWGRVASFQFPGL